MQCQIRHLFWVFCFLCLYFLTIFTNALPVSENESKIPYPRVERNPFDDVASLEANESIILPLQPSSSPSPQESVTSEATRILGQAPARESMINITEFQCKNNFATLKWLPSITIPENTLSYKVLYSDDNHTWTEMNFIITATEAPVKGLFPDTHYRFRVRGTNAQNHIYQSQIVSCNTTEDFPVYNPTIVSAYRRGENDVIVRWKPLVRREMGTSKQFWYEAYLYSKEHDLPSQLKVHVIKDGSSEYRFSDIPNIKDKKLAVWVNSVNHMGSSRQPQVLIDVTEESRPQYAPQIITVEVIDSNKANVIWNSVPASSVNGNFEGLFSICFACILIFLTFFSIISSLRS